MYLIGSRESSNVNLTYSRLILYVDRCREAEHCASEKDIEEFVHDKIFDIQYLDNKPNFDSFKNFINQQQAYIGSFPITTGGFTDLGFSFTKNTYDRKDNWIYGSSEVNEFYDVVPDYIDKFNLSPKDIKVKPYAEIYIYLNNNIKEHEREVEHVDAYFESIAGLHGFLLEILGWFFGGYLAHASMVAWVKYF